MVTYRGPVISFGLEELSGVTTPHIDALVIQAIIVANYVAVKVFVDTGSKVNIIFKDAFDQMQVDMTELHHSTTALFGFIGHQVYPLGQVSLPLSLGKDACRQTRATIFSVVNSPSAYILIL